MIKLNNISKKFKIHYESPALIKTALPFLKSPGSVEVLWALKNISFEFEAGKCYALIGRNGSGKSTLLQIICGILTPTMGDISVRGKVSTLLELCSGFHPELTGKENIYLNSSIMGISRREIEQKFDDILKFSELDKFIDSKIKIYSAGMFMRLGFAIAIQMKFDIFLCDEVIAVGDMKFQHKCFDKIMEFKNSGKCIIFASHDLNAVGRIADYIIWLDNGKIKTQGPAAEIIGRYINENQ